MTARDRRKRSRRDRLTKQVRDDARRAKQLDQEVKMLQDQLDLERHRVDVLQETVAELNQERARLKVDFHNAMQQVDELGGVAAELRRNLSDSRATSDKLLKGNNRLSSELEKLLAEDRDSAKLRKRLRRKTEELEAARIQLNQLKAHVANERRGVLLTKGAGPKLEFGEEQ